MCSLHSVIQKTCGNAQTNGTIWDEKWETIMDDQGRPSDFQHAISATMSTRTLSGFNDLEDVLLASGRVGGACMKQKQRFRESTILQSLRSDRRMAQSVEESS